jgi:stress-induced morphogen
MSSGKITIPEWERLRTDESRRIEDLLRQHFQSADAYRYNSASLRVRVVDPSFKGLSREQRDDCVEPILSKLDESTQADIMNLVLLYPEEVHDSFRAHVNNEEFEHPSQSML